MPDDAPAEKMRISGPSDQMGEVAVGMKTGPWSVGPDLHAGR
jgi:hypothetical protein